VQTHEPAAYPTAPPPGWYPDPWQQATRRWWDGIAWTGYLRNEVQTTAVAPTLRRARDDLTGAGVALLGFFGAFALAMIFSFVATTIVGLPDDSVAVTVISMSGLWGGLFMAAWIVTHRRPGGSLHDVGFYAPRPKEIVLGIAIAFLAIYVEARVLAVLRELLPPDNNGLGSNVFVAHTPSPMAIFVTALLVCVGAPIFEELYFRGVVQGILTHRCGVIPAIIIQAVLFGCAHYQFGMTATQATVRIVAITIVGLFLGWLRQHTGRLGAGIAAHATNNIIVVLVTIAMLNR
jgi:membrane protease YdiL (CAAX protease family)